MARVKDLWHAEVKDPGDPEKKIKKKTRRHPDLGGSKDAKRWLAIWLGPDGKEKTKAFLNKEPAKLYAARQEADVDRDEYVDPKEGKKVLGPVALKWLRLRDIGASSRAVYETVYRLHIEPTFGKRQVRSVVPSEVLEWLRGLGKTHGEVTQEKAHWILRSVFDLAVADNMRRDNPVRSPIIPRPKPQINEEREAWAADRVRLVIEKHPEHYRLIPTLAAGLGLRQGEAFGLAKGDFDFEAGKVTVRRQVIRIGKIIVFKLPKGGKERVVPLSPGLARLVQAQIEANEPTAYVLPWMKEDGELAEEEHSCKLLFRWHGDHPRTHGQCLQTSSYNDVVWKAALSKAGITGPAVKNARGSYRYPSEGRENGMHALRHFYATALQDAGVSVAGAAAFLGHSLKGGPVTLRVYSHVTEETFEAARVAIDRALFKLRLVQDQSANGTGAELAVGE